ncbi:GAF domain-containing protein [Streptomyces sp. p1417]|uniref:GAF domain-containing protein n=1 Tax=Streptomyces typhae TaxID=2681492 RepID=A0A6L6X960_9ACTN|nr:GAF domain-containing protein [Streptomyces typhae]MVO90227.1 GAF domain-containing protein [Streptomyces typhae]
MTHHPLAASRPVPQGAGAAPLALPHRNAQGTARRPAAPAPDCIAVTDQQARQAAELEQRYDLLKYLKVPTQPSDDLDKMASDMARETGFLYGFVNLFLGEQTFVGLHQPPAGSGHFVIGRTMSLEHGWCPEVVNRRKSLPLHDVHASPRFSGNHVVDAVGIRSYFGAPLIHESGVVLGTVCVIDPEKRHLEQAERLRDTVIEGAARVMKHLAPPAPGR